MTSQTNPMAAAQITAQYDLIEDYQETLVPPVGATPDTLVVAYDEAGQKELLSVSKSAEKIVRFYNKPSSGSGWAREEVSVLSNARQPPTGSIDKLLAFYAGPNLYVFAHYGTSTGAANVAGMVRTPARQWLALDLEGELGNSLTSMSQTDFLVCDQGQAFLYGVSTSTGPTSPLFVVAATAGKNLTQIHQSWAKDGSYSLLPGSGDDELTVLGLDEDTASFRGASVRHGRLEIGPASSYNLGLGPLSSEQVCAIPFSGSSPGFLLRTIAGQLLLVTGYNEGAAPTTTTLTTSDTSGPEEVSQVVAGTDSSGSTFVFAAQAPTADEPTQALWLLRQTAGASGFDAWVPLGTTVTAIAAYGPTNDGPDVFYYDTSDQVARLSQAAGDTLWDVATLAVAAPPGKDGPAPANTYTMELSPVNAAGVALPNTAVSLEVDRATMLNVNGIATPCAPGQPVPATSDPMGRVTVAGTATALYAPTITATVPGIAPCSFSADVHAHAKLARATSADVEGLGVPPGNAQQVTGPINELAKAAAALQGAPPTPRSGTTFTLSFSDHVVVCRKAEPPPELEGIAAIFGDVAHYFSQELDDLEKITVNIVDDAVNVFIQGTKYLVDGCQFALEEASEVAKCIELILLHAAEAAADVIGEAIAWLRKIFDWDAILETQKVLAYFVNQALDNARNDLEGAKAVLPRGVEKAKSEISGAFEKLEASFGGLTVNQVSPKASSNPYLDNGSGAPVIGAPGLTAAYSRHSVRCNYARTKLLSGQATIRRPSEAQPRGTAPQTVIDFFEKAFPDTSKLENGFHAAKEPFVHTTGGLFDTALVDLLTACEDLIDATLDGAEVLLEGILHLAEDGLSDFQKLLNHDIEVPVVSSLFQAIADEPLTLLNGATLALAIPLTVLSEVITQQPPFPDASTILSQDIPWVSPPGPGTPAPDTTATLDPAVAEGLAAAFLCVSIDYAALDMALDTAAAMGSQDVDSDVTTLLSSMGVLASWLLQGTGVPLQAMTASPKTNADYFTMFTWGAAWGPVLADTVCLATTYKVLRLSGDKGPWADCILGTFQLALATVTALTMADRRAQFEGYSRITEAEVILPAFPYVLQPVVTVPDVQLRFQLTAALLVVDLGCDLGTGALKLAAACSTPPIRFIGATFTNETTSTEWKPQVAYETTFGEVRRIYLAAPSQTDTDRRLIANVTKITISDPDNAYPSVTRSVPAGASAIVSMAATLVDDEGALSVEIVIGAQ